MRSEEPHFQLSNPIMIVLNIDNHFLTALKNDVSTWSFIYNFDKDKNLRNADL